MRPCAITRQVARRLQGRPYGGRTLVGVDPAHDRGIFRGAEALRGARPDARRSPFASAQPVPRRARHRVAAGEPRRIGPQASRGAAPGRNRAQRDGAAHRRDRPGRPRPRPVHPPRPPSRSGHQGRGRRCLPRRPAAHQRARSARGGGVVGLGLPHPHDPAARSPARTVLAVRVPMAARGSAARERRDPRDRSAVRARRSRGRRRTG